MANNPAPRDARRRATYAAIAAFILSALASPAHAAGTAPAVTGGKEAIPADKVSAEDEDFRVLEGNDGYVFTQRLKWESVEHALKYRITVEQRGKAGKWERIAEAESATNEAEVSLAAGNYRYRIAVFNLLEKEAITTDWIEFEVIRAYQPGLSDVSPESIYLEEESPGTFRISGERLMPETAFTLVPYLRTGRAIRGSIESVERKGNRAVISFPPDAVDVGSWTVRAVNPGGLSATSKPVKVAFRKPRDLDVSLGYAMGFVPFDSTIRDYFGSTVLPAGMTARVTAILVKRSFGRFGLACSGTLTGKRYGQDTYDISTMIAFARLYVAYQRPLIKNKLMLDARLGGGLGGLRALHLDYENDISSPDFTTWSPAASAGLALQYYLKKRLYLEAGCDFDVAFMNGMTLGAVLPGMSAGWQF